MPLTAAVEAYSPVSTRHSKDSTSAEGDWIVKVACDHALLAGGLAIILVSGNFPNSCTNALMLRAVPLYFGSSLIATILITGRSIAIPSKA